MFQTAIILMSVVLGSVDRLAPKSARVDLIEINQRVVHGQPAYEQVIFYDWSPDYRRYHCQGWSLRFDVMRKPGKYVVRLPENRFIEAPIIRYTVTEDDPERENTKLFPPEHRRKLW